MGQICSFFRSICFCFKAKSENMFEEQLSRTPSEIPANQLTEEFKIPNNKFQSIDGVFLYKGYDPKTEKFLAKGGYGTVYTIIRIVDGKELALKVISKIHDDPNLFKYVKEELFIVSKIRHKNIISLLDHFIINRSCYFVMELANNKTVEEEVKTLGPMSETKAKTYFIQVVKAIEYLHTHKPHPIAHRDLKLDNILIHIENNEKILKITDFGFSKYLKQKPGKKLFRARYAVGTPPYMSPQLILLVFFQNADTQDSNDLIEFQKFNIKVKSVNTMKTDIWALGVCLYVMVNNEYPFGRDPKKFLDMFKKQLKRDVPFTGKESPQLKNLLNQMLEYETKLRTDITQVVNHEWLSGVSDVIDLIQN